MFLAQRSPYCEDSASIVLLLPDVKHRDLQHLLACIVGLESYQSDKLQALVQLLQIQTKFESPTGKNEVAETCREKEESDNDVDCSNGFIERRDLLRHIMNHDEAKKTAERLAYFSVSPANVVLFSSYRYIPEDMMDLVRSQIFDTPMMKRRHIASVHRKEKPWPCGLEGCDRSFSSEALMLRHRTDHGERPFGLTVKSDLSDHERVHSGEERPHYCDICQKHFSTSNTLRAHKMIHEELKRYACDVESCDKTFKINKNLVRHKRVEHGIVPGGNLSQIAECEVCGKRCGDRNQLEKHKIKHTTEKNFVCSVCGKRLKRQHSLELHMRQHTGSRSYGCDECDQAYFTASALRNHKVCKHTELTESWLCTFCGKAFTKKANLEQHVTLHTGEKKYQCVHCEKRFRSHSVYQNHLRAHLGKKEFVCQYCGKAFMQKSHLSRHTATHTGERKHSCPVCAKTFIEPGDVRKHLRTHSKERPPGECEALPAVFTAN